MDIAAVRFSGKRRKKVACQCRLTNRDKSQQWSLTLVLQLVQYNCIEWWRHLRLTCWLSDWLVYISAFIKLASLSWRVTVAYTFRRISIVYVGAHKVAVARVILCIWWTGTLRAATLLYCAPPALPASGEFSPPAKRRECIRGHLSQCLYHNLYSPITR